MRRENHSIMVHSICIYVILFVFFSPLLPVFIYAAACQLPKPVPLIGHNRINILLNG